VIDGQCSAICFGVTDVAPVYRRSIAVVPAYLVITNDEAAEDQRRTAKRACIVMTILLIFFAATGNLLFRAFAITLPAFRTAGGLILWYVAMDMLRGERRTQGGQEEVLEGQTKEDVAITPLAIPMLAGPAQFRQSLYFRPKHEVWSSRESSTARWS